MVIMIKPAIFKILYWRRLKLDHVSVFWVYIDTR